MNSDEAHSVWRAPRWTLAVLLAALGMLGPFSIDTYLPAFQGIASALDATPLQMQQTLSVYLFGFAFMNLFHGALADSFGRRPVLLTGCAVFTLASIGCALSEQVGTLVLFRALQGLSAGAGMVVSRVVIRDLFPPAEAQQMMSQVTIFFGLAPAIAPVIGGQLLAHVGWEAIFWFLALIGLALWVAGWRLLPETLPAPQRQSFQAAHLLRGYRQLGGDRQFLLLVLSSGVPFNGMFLYVLAAPIFLGEHLQLAPTQFFWFFLTTIAGVMAGAWLSGRMAGRLAPQVQIRRGFLIMAGVSLANVVGNLLWPPALPWALLPIALYAFGWAQAAPAVTLQLLDLFPERRGMASSLQAAIGSAANGLVAGVLVPLVMHSSIALAVASLALMAVGFGAWLRVGPPRATSR